jgi:O-acetyl-ADP-ribose deacetylase (regulator of RNase III)
MEAKVSQTAVRLVKGDITDLEVEAFVFDIEENLKLGSGYGGAIAVRGGPGIQKELDEIGTLPVGQATVTSAGNMKAKYIVHAVGPKFQEEDEGRKMRDAVLNALKAAEEKGIKQIALPPMGTGMFFFPLDKCAKIMVDSVKTYLANGTRIEEVIFCALDSREFKPFESELKSL